MTKCLFNALLFTVMEIVFPALLHQKSGSVTLTLFWAKLCRCISHYDSQMKTFCWHSSRALSRAGSPDGNAAQRDGDGLRGWAMSWCPGLSQPGNGSLALKCFGTEQREALPSWCSTALSPVPWGHFYPANSAGNEVPLDFLTGVNCRQTGKVD